LRARHQRPPDRRIGFISLAGAWIIMAVAVGLRLAGEPSDGRIGPYEELTPLFIFLVGLSGVFSGISDLQAPAERATILCLRLVSTTLRLAAFATWMITLIGLLAE
jgi:hypothetical protein